MNFWRRFACFIEKNRKNPVSNILLCPVVGRQSKIPLEIDSAISRQNHPLDGNECATVLL